MVFGRERTPDSDSPHRKTFNGTYSEKLDIHWSVADQWLADENGPRIRTHRPGLPLVKLTARWKFTLIMVYIEQASKEVDNLFYWTSLYEVQNDTDLMINSNAALWILVSSTHPERSQPCSRDRKILFELKGCQ